jgi:hypothetical protein
VKPSFQRRNHFQRISLAIVAGKSRFVTAGSPLAAIVRRHRGLGRLMAEKIRAESALRRIAMSKSPD